MGLCESVFDYHLKFAYKNVKIFHEGATINSVKSNRAKKDLDGAACDAFH